MKIPDSQATPLEDPEQVLLDILDFVVLNKTGACDSPVQRPDSCEF